ncbi:MAG: M20 family metallopeptidase [Anaerolineae bacterium]|nr:MAG: M20 family metallopeptidase [Anaerolineae bacterium]
MTDNQRILAYLRDHQDDMVVLLTRIVEMESPTNDKPSLDRLGAFLADQVCGLGAQVETFPQTHAGDHVRAQWGNGPGGVLLLCHMDTVWDLGTVAGRPVRIEGGNLYGPGAFDMKGGIVNTLWAMRVLRDLNLLPRRRVTLIINSDEETGTVTSRATIEAEALKHDVVFVMEPAQPPHGSLKTWRKGVGGFQVTVTGLAAHAGADHEKGINAVEELAHQILAIQGFTDYQTGTTLNVGVVGGGTRSNVFPAEAWAQVDVRVMNAEEAARIEARMRGLRPRLKGTTVEVSGGVNRPPMVRTREIVALYNKAAALAAEMGFQISEAGTGGGSDGNFTAALGVPTLDGMGVVGDGGHALHEYAVIASLPERAALLAAMVRDP